MNEEYVSRKFRSASLALILKCNEILGSYAAQGFDMTLRQLYYQLVSRNEIPNNQKSYDRLGDLVNNGRLAGLIDWEHIVDRSRTLQKLATWKSPGQIIGAVASQYRVDKWKGQTYRPEVWVEKQALAGVFQRVCDELEIPLFACKGYPSLTAIYEAATQRFLIHEAEGQTPYILHFGDHDPSGVDMTRDIEDRLMTLACFPEVKRMALNMDQVHEYNPPPNFAKLSDTRSKRYVSQYGRQSWELDALQPDVLAGIVRAEIEPLIDADVWSETAAEEAEQKAVLKKISDNYDRVVGFLNA